MEPGQSDKCRDQAAVTAASKLLNSAKKSVTKKSVKRLKLSLQRASSSAVNQKSTVRGLTFSSNIDFNDSGEFKDAVTFKTMPKPQGADRKRKKTFPDDECQKMKIRRHKKNDSHSGISGQRHADVPNDSSMGTSPEQRVNLKRLTEKICSAVRSVTACEAKVLSASSAICERKMLNSESSTVCETETSDSESGVKDRDHHQKVVSDSDTTRLASCEEEEETESQRESELSSTQHTCPACGLMLRHGSFVRHMQGCLKQHFVDEDQDCPLEPKDGKGNDLESSGKPVQLGPGEEKGLSLEYTFCQLCQKDISHLNSHWRRLHVNRCMDQEEKQKEQMEEKQRALEAAKTQVLDCPMCGKVLRSALSRKSHLKKCASSLGVTTDQLLATVKRQEEEHLAALAAGKLPSSYRPGHSTRQNSTSSRRGRTTLPKSKLDEDTQLALALSSSLHPQTEVAGPSAVGPAKRGRKQKEEEDHLLMKLTSSQAAERIETRVSDLIMQQEDEEEETIPPLPTVSQQSLHGNTMQTVRWSGEEDLAQSKMFWKLSSLEEQNGTSTQFSSPDKSLQFYVPALMPPVQVSKIMTGSKLRRMSEIPGRHSSQEVRRQTPVEPSDEQIDQKAAEDLPPFSTQTAALLADMAAEADGMDISHSSSSSQSSVCEVDALAYQELLSAFSSLVNQHQFSDVEILAAQTTTLYAHRVILSVRCPPLLKLADKGSGRVNLSDCAPQCVLALLHFLYTGVIEVEPCFVPQTLQLADRFNLTTFLEICRSQLTSEGSPDLTVQRNKAMDVEQTDVLAVSGTVSVHSVKKEDSIDTEDRNRKENPLSVTTVCGNQKWCKTATRTNSNPQRQSDEDDSAVKVNSDVSSNRQSYGPQNKKQVQYSQSYRSQNEEKEHNSWSCAKQVDSACLQAKDGADSFMEKNSLIFDEEGDLNLIAYEQKQDTQMVCNMTDKAERDRNETVPATSSGLTVSTISQSRTGSTSSLKNSFQSSVQGDDTLCSADDRTLNNSSLISNLVNTKPQTSEGNECVQTKASKQLDQGQITLQKRSGHTANAENSDDDLFSSDYSDVSFSSSVPGLGLKALTAHGAVQDSQHIDSAIRHGESAKDDAEQKSGSHSFVSALGNKADDSRDYCSEVEVRERMRAPDTCSLSADGPCSVLEDSSVSMLDMEISHRQSRHFKISTPHQRTEDRKIRRTTLRDKHLSHPNREDANIFSETCHNPVRKPSKKYFQNYDMTPLNDKMVDSDSMPQAGVSPSPSMSVVEQDSQYVTPAIAESKVRKTFQLVTLAPYPSSLQSPETPASHFDAGSAVSKQVSACSTRHSVGKDRSNLKTHKDVRSPEEIHPLQSQESKENRDRLNGENDIDSDLEIVEPSFQKSPSPKFSLLSRLRCNQSGKMTGSTNQEVSHNRQLSPVVSSQASRVKTLSQSTVPKQQESGADHSRQADSGDDCVTDSPFKPSPYHRFSQQSADSDKEMLRATELMTRHVPDTEESYPQKGGLHGKGDPGLLTDHDRSIADPARPVEDVWDGFEDIHNPDLELIGNDPDAPSANNLYCRTPSPCASPKSSVRSPVAHSPASSVTSHYKTPVKSLAATSDENSPQKYSPAAHSQLRSVSGQSKQKYDGNIYTDHSTPVRSKSSSLRSSTKKRETVKDRATEKENKADQQQLAAEALPFDEDTEMANCSFLWSEENEPVEENNESEEMSHHKAKMELDTVLTVQDKERPAMKTPTMKKQIKKGEKSGWVPPSPFTPMPPYDDMSTPDLKHEVQKFGLKPVGKKRMKMALKDIYEQTHQYETDSDYEEDASFLPDLSAPVRPKEVSVDTRQPSVLHKHPDPLTRMRPSNKSGPPASQKQKDGRKTQMEQPSVQKGQPVGKQKAVHQPPVLSKERAAAKNPVGRPKTKRGLAKNAEESEVHNTKGGQPTSRKAVQMNDIKFPTHSSCQSPIKGRMGRDEGKQQSAASQSPMKSVTDSSSPEKHSLSSSQDSDGSEQPDVSVFEEGRADSDDNEDITPSQQVAVKDLPQKLMAFFLGHPTLYQKILMYEPLDLGIVKEDLKTAGIKCSQDKLLDFLDEKCITFTTKNMIPRKRQRRGKKSPARKVTASQK